MKRLRAATADAYPGGARGTNERIVAIAKRIKVLEDLLTQVDVVKLAAQVEEIQKFLEEGDDALDDVDTEDAEFDPDNEEDIEEGVEGVTIEDEEDDPDIVIKPKALKKLRPVTAPFKSPMKQVFCENSKNV